MKAKVIDLFTMVAEDLTKATDVLLSGTTEMVRALAERDRVIDALYLEIEDLADRERPWPYEHDVYRSVCKPQGHRQPRE
jgi:phosphate uptake regulator